MAFNSLSFLFLFLPVFLLVYSCFPLRIKNYLLSFFSLIFLCWAGPSYSLVLIFSVILNWSLSVFIAKYIEKKSGKILFYVAVISNLLLLIVFKYSTFLLGNINNILLPTGFHTFKIPSLLLPLGISFYTFRLLSYQIELFRGKIELEQKFLNLFLYTAYFPQLGAGPIVRYSDFYKQITERKHSLSLFRNGLQRFLFGLIKKVLIANNLGIMADAVFSLSPHELTFTVSWIGVLAYTLQVYYDFSGYTDMAIGLSRMTGFSAPENFNFPYLARSVKDFWTRWHMSLTQWFRDFLFLPIAYSFSRKLPERRYLSLKSDHLIYTFSILITWFLVGFWHGASWTFIAWGITFGLFLIIEQLGFGRKLKKTTRFLQHLYTLSIVILAWIFFRADSFEQGFTLIKGIIGFNGMEPGDFEYYRYCTGSFIAVFIVAVAGAGGWLKTLRLYLWKLVLQNERNKLIFRIIVAGFLLIGFQLAVAEILRGGYSPFIYFKF